jgi:Ser/Thr protein kinase RdoA (MazF antagonist)
MDDIAVPASVLAAYGLEGSELTHVPSGHINATWLIKHRRGQFVLQRLSTIFSAEIHYNISAVTRHLAERGVVTPRLTSTKDNRLWTRDEQGQVWRVMTFIPGEIYTHARDAAMCKSASLLAGRFHRALADLEHTYVGKRPGIHDTRRHLAKLRDAGRDFSEHRNFKAVDRVAQAILTRAAELPALNGLPLRHTHGDLKISNVVFAPTGEAISLIDHDTLGQMPLAIELGDAWRSWCNASEEDSLDSRLDPQLFAAAVEGYAASAPALMGAEEWRLLVAAVETIAVELAARFCRDALEESYFGWDSSRYPSASDHNLARAKSQLRLAESIGSQRRDLEAVVERAFAAAHA